MKSAEIVSLCVGSAILYGIVHDQITARICVEYFTIGHPPMFGTVDPTLLGIGWGIIATWWVGFLLGIPLSFAARFGPRPKRDARSMIRPILGLLAVMAGSAVISGIIGYVCAKSGGVRLVESFFPAVPIDRRVGFLVDLWAHNASYFGGFVGGLVVIVRIGRSRRWVSSLSFAQGAAEERRKA